MTRYRRPLQAVLDPDQQGWPARPEVDPDLDRENFDDHMEALNERFGREDGERV